MVRVETTDPDQLDKLSAEFLTAMRSGVRTVLARVADELDEDDPLIGLGPQIDNVWYAQVEDELMPQLRQRLYESADDLQSQLQTNANLLVAAVEPAPGALEIPPVRDGDAERYLKTRVNFVRGFSSVLWQLVRAALLGGMQEGEGIAELRDRVLAVEPLTVGRAERIARTEVVGASNAGAFQQMETAGLEATKEWLATNDQRTRDTHWDADGQTVDLNAPFTVGGVPMMRPHDPAGPASEVVNCRCTMVFDVAEDELVASLATQTRATLNIGGAKMPWTKVEDHVSCPVDTPWAVVREDSGEVEGCHASEEDANEQIAALYATEDDDKDSSEAELATEPEAQLQADGEIEPIGSGAGWQGVLVVEGVTTGDGREFSPDALGWADLPIPLRWNKEDSHGGDVSQTVAVNVGKIDEIWRDGEKILGRGVFNLDSENGQQAFDLVKGEFLRGVSVDLDDIGEADLEMVFPDDGDSGGDDDEVSIMMMPEKVIIHGGRIRAATLVDIPAFVEAYIELADGELVASATEFGAVGSHKTATSDGSWDGPANERRLPSPMPMAKARAAYAWIADGASGPDGVTKSDCKFIHHEVSADGTVGAANLTACSTGIGVLNGGRGGTTIPADQRRGVYNHLAAHLRDGGQEPPEATFEEETVTAALELDEQRPPVDWFQNPKLSLLTGITVTDSGRVYGHAAEWNQCHVGRPDVCTTAPFEDDHPYFMTGEVVCADGSRVPVGQITLGTGHAPLTVNASRAVEHYDNTGAVVADVAVGNDDHGIWVAGQIRPGTDPARVRELRASGQVSGDWRRIGGSLRLVGLLAVNVAGFPVPKIGARVASGSPMALVAAGRPTVSRHGRWEQQAEQERAKLRAIRDSMVRRVHGVKSGGE